MKKTFALLVTFLMLGSIAFGQKLDKLTLEDLTKRHLASVGTPEDLTAMKSIVATGQGSFASLIKDTGRLSGPAQFASEGTKSVFAIVFDNPQLPYEKAAFDGKDITVGYPNGITTRLAAFLKTREAILKEGLFGGTLSAAWPFYNMSARKAKAEVTSDKFDGKQYYKVKYSPKGESLRISLFFDPETFRHVRSEYEYQVEAQMGATATSSPQTKADVYLMREDFDDFKTFGKLTFPTSHKITVTVQKPTSGNQGTVSFQWSSVFDKVLLNEPIDAVSFKVS